MAVSDSRDCAIASALPAFSNSSNSPASFTSEICTVLSERAAARAVAVFSTPTTRTPGLSTSANDLIGESGATRYVLCSTIWAGPKSTFLRRSSSTGMKATSQALLVRRIGQRAGMRVMHEIDRHVELAGKFRPEIDARCRACLPFSIATLPAPGVGPMAIATRNFPVGYEFFADAIHQSPCACPIITIDAQMIPPNRAVFIALSMHGSIARGFSRTAQMQAIDSAPRWYQDRNHAEYCREAPRIPPSA